MFRSRICRLCYRCICIDACPFGFCFVLFPPKFSLPFVPGSDILTQEDFSSDLGAVTSLRFGRWPLDDVMSAVGREGMLLTGSCTPASFRTLALGRRFVGSRTRGQAPFLYPQFIKAERFRRPSFCVTARPARAAAPLHCYQIRSPRPVETPCRRHGLPLSS